MIGQVKKNKQNNWSKCNNANFIPRSNVLPVYPVLFYPNSIFSDMIKQIATDISR